MVFFVSQKFSGTVSCIAIIDSHFLIQYFLFHCLSHTVAAYTQTISYSHTNRSLRSCCCYACIGSILLCIYIFVGVHSAYRKYRSIIDFSRLAVVCYRKHLLACQSVRISYVHEFASMVSIVAHCFCFESAVGFIFWGDIHNCSCLARKF